jgi:hypothetical protein
METNKTDILKRITEFETEIEKATSASIIPEIF